MLLGFYATGACWSNEWLWLDLWSPTFTHRHRVGILLRFRGLVGQALELKGGIFDGEALERKAIGAGNLHHALEF